MEVSDLLRRVRSLIAKAEDCEKPESTAFSPEESQAYRAKADELMTKYAVDEALLQASRPAGMRTLPGSIELELAGGGFEMQHYLCNLLESIAYHNRCKLRSYGRYDYDKKCWMAKVYGFEADLRFVEMLYTTLRLHMLDALRPKIHPGLTLETNCYRLHKAGYNWLEIARMYGWRKSVAYGSETGEIWENKDGRRWGNHKVGSMYKRACYRGYRARGEEPERIPAGATQTYRSSAAQGYTSGISSRLRQASSGRGAGTDIVLRGQMDLIDELFRNDNADLFAEPEPVTDPPKKSGRKTAAYKPPPFSRSAYEAGHAHAQTADLTNNSTAEGRKREVSS